MSELPNLDRDVWTTESRSRCLNYQILVNIPIWTTKSWWICLNYQLLVEIAPLLDSIVNSCMCRTLCYLPTLQRTFFHTSWRVEQLCSHILAESSMFTMSSYVHAETARTWSITVIYYTPSSLSEIKKWGKLSKFRPPSPNFKTYNFVEDRLRHTLKL